MSIAPSIPLSGTFASATGSTAITTQPQTEVEPVGIVYGQSIGKVEIHRLQLAVGTCCGADDDVGGDVRGCGFLRRPATTECWFRFFFRLWLLFLRIDVCECGAAFFFDEDEVQIENECADDDGE